MQLIFTNLPLEVPAALAKVSFPNLTDLFNDY
jgi:hypothetical protein